MGRRFHGIAASDGIAFGRAFLLARTTENIEEQHDISVQDEIGRLARVVAQAKQELVGLYEVALERLGASHAQIFMAHTQILEDPAFVGEVENRIRSQHVNAEFALTTVTSEWVSMFEQLEDDYIRQRASDIMDVSQRVLMHLQGINSTSLVSIQEPVVLIAKDLAPSDTVLLNKNMVHAFITDVGGRTSHSAIMARSMGIPAVVGLGVVSESIQPDSFVIVNGFDGEVIVDPSPEEITQFTQRLQSNEINKQQLQSMRDKPSITRDGHVVELGGNIGTPIHVQGVLANGGEGIGLFRSEFLYMNRSTAPTEEEQFEAYRQVAVEMSGMPVIIRTLDVGGDKEIPYLNLPHEANPFLGYRAIRVSLDRTELLLTQLRAVLRASQYGNIKLMFPMISTITEIRQAKRILETVKDDLRSKSIPFDDHLEVGIMVEIPAAAVAADLLAKEVDFFSIGTNDLIQYTMACDRLNERISHLYQPYHPAVLRLIHMVIEGAHRHGKRVGMCGEMAGDPIAVPILLGLGLDEFSMSASSILNVRQLIRDLTYERAQALAQRALEQDSQEAVQILIAGWKEAGEVN